MVSDFNRMIKIFTLTVVLLASVFPFSQVKANIPVTADTIPSNSTTGATTSNSTVIALSDFTKAIKDGKSVVRGVYVPDVMAFRVIQQPKNQNGFVSTIRGLVTQFAMASDYGTIGLLAHNFAAGSEFPKVLVGNTINVIYGDGTIKEFTVTRIARYQALQPNSTSSNFLDLGNKRKTIRRSIIQSSIRWKSSPDITNLHSSR